MAGLSGEPKALITLLAVQGACVVNSRTMERRHHSLTAECSVTGNRIARLMGFSAPRNWCVSFACSGSRISDHGKWRDTGEGFVSCSSNCEKDWRGEISMSGRVDECVCMYVCVKAGQVDT